jgi:hypothetical protein
MADIDQFDPTLHIYERLVIFTTIASLHPPHSVSFLFLKKMTPLPFFPGTKASVTSNTID